jgi:dihydrofolate synthase/folylpolyglutamate synthase
MSSYTARTGKWKKVFENACAERGAKLTRADFSGIVVHDFGIDGQTFSFEKYDRLKIKLLGRHQTRNAALAVKAVEILRKKGFAISDEALRRGLEKARWPGRLEVLSKDPVVLIDGAHNAEGAVMLKNAIDEYFPGRPITYIIGVSKDKDYREMMKTVLPGCKRVFAVTARSPKALPAEILSNVAADYCKNVQVSDTIESAVRKSIETAESGEVICAFGSLYYIGEVRDMFEQ